MRIKNNGDLEFCRWTDYFSAGIKANIRDTDIVQWFQNSVSPIRQRLLAGEILSECQQCQIMEQHGKVSGRQRQLLKIGVDDNNFAKSMLSSPWLPEFQYSHENSGHTRQYPQDWQIDLGNYCNSACIFCDAESSSRLASELLKLQIINHPPPQPWCDDPDLIDKFVRMLELSPRLTYLHFIGGETLITPAFVKILQALVKLNLHKQVTIGFTTNLTTWDEKVVDLLCEFHGVNLGMSVECVNPLNDYVRYGGKLDESLAILQQWNQLGKKQKWLMQIRSTPTVLSIWHLDSLYRYALSHGISIESCNFLDNPKFMRPSVLPMPLRQQVIDKLQKILQEYNLTLDIGDSTINVRSPEFFKSYMTEDIRSYIRYLRDQPDESHRLSDLVVYLKKLEANRRNSVLDYLPEYETILRSVGY